MASIIIKLDMYFFSSPLFAKGLKDIVPQRSHSWLLPIYLQSLEMILTTLHRK